MELKSNSFIKVTESFTPLKPTVTMEENFAWILKYEDASVTNKHIIKEYVIL